MTAEAREMARQLRFWGRKILELTEQTHGVGRRTPFEDLMRLDELRVLHVLAEARLDALHATTGAERKHLEAEIDIMCSELRSALGRPRPRVRETNRSDGVHRTIETIGIGRSNGTNGSSGANGTNRSNGTNGTKA